jgi:hypothetical protein
VCDATRADPNANWSTQEIAGFLLNTEALQRDKVMQLLSYEFQPIRSDSIRFFPHTSFWMDGGSSRHQRFVCLYVGQGPSLPRDPRFIHGESRLAAQNALIIGRASPAAFRCGTDRCNLLRDRAPLSVGVDVGRTRMRRRATLCGSTKPSRSSFANSRCHWPAPAQPICSCPRFARVATWRL